MSASLSAKLQLDIAQYQAQLAKARGEAKKFKDQLQSQGGFGKLLAGAGSLGAVAGLGVGLTTLIRRGMEFNQTMGDSQTAIANVLRQFKGLSVEAAKQEAAKAMKAMVDLEPQTAASLTGLVDGFLATLGSSQAAGISVEENIALVGKFANALANANIPAEQLAQEMRSIVSGNIGADSTLAKVLNIKSADITKAQTAGQLYNYLVGKIGSLGEAGDTAGVAFSSLNSALDKAAGALTKGLFDQTVSGAKELSTLLDENAATFERLGESAGVLVGWLVQAVGLVSDYGARLGRMQFVNHGDGQDTVDPKLMENLKKRGMTKEMNEINNGRVGDMDQFSKNALARDKIDRSRERAGGEANGASSSAGGGVGSGSAPDAKEQARAQREINAMLEAEATLNERRMADYLSILPPNLKLIEIKREMMRLEEERDGLIGPGFDQKRLEIETDLLNMRKQSRDAEADIADEKERAAEKQKEDDAKAGEQAYALELFEQEMDIINAKIAGNKELTAELERHAAIQALMNQLLDDTNLSEQEALQKATQMVDAKKDLEGKGAEKESKIKGYSRERQGDADDARQRAEDRVNQSRGKRDKAMKDSFGSFEGETQRQKDRFGKEFGDPKAPNPAANPLAAQAQNNANKENAGGQIATNPQQQSAQMVIGLITQILEAVK